ncbi:MAG: hypothetical protein ACTSR1_09075 [Candidatus Heimdallarchaeota archaeon]
MELVIQITIIAFMVLEFSNILALYFKPDFTYANAVGMFNAFEKTKEYQGTYDFVKYLINWVAGTKLIFIMLLVVILLFGNDITLLYSLAALVASIASYYIGLLPLIRKMDKRDEITPKNYSIVLTIMISTFIVAFLVVFLLSIFL